MIGMRGKINKARAKFWLAFLPLWGRAPSDWCTQHAGNPRRATGTKITRENKIKILDIDFIMRHWRWSSVDFFCLLLLAKRGHIPRVTRSSGQVLRPAEGVTTRGMICSLLISFYFVCHTTKHQQQHYATAASEASCQRKRSREKE